MPRYGERDPNDDALQSKVQKATENLLSWARSPEGHWTGWNTELIDRAELYRIAFRELHAYRNPEKNNGGQEGK